MPSSYGTLKVLINVLYYVSRDLSGCTSFSDGFVPVTAFVSFPTCLETGELDEKGISKTPFSPELLATQCDASVSRARSRSLLLVTTRIHICFSNNNVRPLSMTIL